METNFKNQTHTCSCCRRSLPRTAFYINKQTQRADRYCIECRKTLSRAKHQNSLAINVHHSLVITDIKDPELRMNLIRHARLLVKISIERKNKKRREEEYCKEEVRSH